MLEEERNRWELDSLTTRQGRYPTTAGAIFPAKHPFGQLLSHPRRMHQKRPSVAIFRPVKPGVTCRKSQFPIFALPSASIAHKNGEIPTYTQPVYKEAGFTLSQHNHAGIVTTRSGLPPLRVLIGGVKRSVMRAQLLQWIQQHSRCAVRPGQGVARAFYSATGKHSSDFLPRHLNPGAQLHG